MSLYSVRLLTFLRVSLDPRLVCNDEVLLTLLLSLLYVETSGAKYGCAGKPGSRSRAASRTLDTSINTSTR